MRYDLPYEIYITENKEAFLKKAVEISQFIGIRPEWLMACMYFESRLNHKAQNKKTGATGLIQFMPATAKHLGTTTEKLLLMSNVQQLDYVKKYFLPYNNKLRSFADVYLTIFFPVAVGKPDTFVIETRQISSELIAKQNPIFDLNKDGEITKGEIKKRLLQYIPDEFKDKF